MSHFDTCTSRLMARDVESASSAPSLPSPHPSHGDTAPKHEHLERVATEPANERVILVPCGDNIWDIVFVFDDELGDPPSGGDDADRPASGTLSESLANLP